MRQEKNLGTYSTSKEWKEPFIHVQDRTDPTGLEGGCLQKQGKNQRLAVKVKTIQSIPSAEKNIQILCYTMCDVTAVRRLPKPFG